MCLFLPFTPPPTQNEPLKSPPNLGLNNVERNKRNNVEIVFTKVETTLKQNCAMLKECFANLFQRRFKFRHQRINFVQH